MQLNKVILDGNIEQKIVKCYREKLGHKSYQMHLTLSKTFCSSSKDALMYMDTWFLIISETDDFLHLEISLLEEILSRSSLLVTTEIEVYKVVAKWINYDFIKRGNFSKRLLRKIRLPLLEGNTLKKILTKKSCFRENKDSLAVVNEILNGNFDFYRNKPSKFFTARRCGHVAFDILCFGGERSADEVVDCKIRRIRCSGGCKNPEIVSSLAVKRYGSKVVYVRGNVYIFGGFDGREESNRSHRHIVKEVEVYSSIANTCKVVANIEDVRGPDLFCYAICGFMEKIYLIGGIDAEVLERDSCVEFDTKDFSWKNKSKMSDEREDPDACVFEDKIIVTGGMQYRDDDFVNFVNYFDVQHHQTINTVEAYDPIDDTWTEFPTMNYSRCQHKSVVVGKKLFVIAGGTDINEVYDSTSKKFTVLKPSFSLYDIRENYLLAAFSVENTYYVYFEDSPNVFCFDTMKGKWFEKPSKLPIEHLSLFSAIQVPRLSSV